MVRPVTISQIYRTARPRSRLVRRGCLVLSFMFITTGETVSSGPPNVGSLVTLDISQSPFAIRHLP